MCGIFGILAHKDSGFSPAVLKTAVEDLYRYSESRGKEASGYSLFDGTTIRVGKSPVPASVLVRDKSFRTVLNEVLGDSVDGNNSQMRRNFCFMGHSRLVTNGRLETNTNNQPVVTKGIVGIHNGIVVNDDEIWRRYPAMQRQYEVDTEVILSLLRHNLDEKKDIDASLRQTFADIYGTASIAVMFEDLANLLLATNNGSLYVCRSADSRAVIFSSELYILNQLLKRKGVTDALGAYSISHVDANTGYLVDLHSLETREIDVRRSAASLNAVPAEPKFAIKLEDTPTNGVRHRAAPEIVIDPASHAAIEREFVKAEALVAKLKRCTKCVLPETMPFIEFDSQGVCNFCRHHTPMKVMGEGPLEEFVKRFRRKEGADCVVTFSGGRDSSYGLHYLKTKLGLNPIAYSYDWGMITDLGRRNQARMCGKLGVEHILVSADIRKKRENIRKNVEAWLKLPDLGTIPLFMAGDKQYFYYANRIMKQTGITLVALCTNPMEKTDFKSGYCGIKPNFMEKNVYRLSLMNKAKMAFYYAKRFALNPAFINSSLFDTAFAFSSYYVMDHDFLPLFDYIRWDEEEINKVLLEEYDWELAKDTKTTWRIGDGTAPFYNYIYYMAAGFNENDTFRSHQIREGFLSRDEALRLVDEENKPRYESIRWYCQTINLDYMHAMKTINAMPRRYPS